MTSFFSIIIPVYNVAPYLRECLDSVLSQTFADWEAVCIDDGSTDGSGAILDEYAAKDKRFRVVHQKNAGVSAARNCGLGLATGKWIGAVDPDDRIDKDFLVDFVVAVRESDADMVWSDYYVNRGGHEIRIRQTCEACVNLMLVKLLCGDLMGSMWNKVFSREFIERHNISFPNQRVVMWEDLWFTASFLSHNPRVKYVKTCGYHYVARDGSACWSQFTLEKLSSEMIVERFLESLDLPQEVLPILQERRMHIKVSAFSSCYIEDSLFYTIYPEIKSLSHFNCGIGQKVLFWLAVRGFRRYTTMIICGIRRLRAVCSLKNTRD